MVEEVEIQEVVNKKSKKELHEYIMSIRKSRRRMLEVAEVSKHPNKQQGSIEPMVTPRKKLTHPFYGELVKIKAYRGNDVHVAH